MILGDWAFVLGFTSEYNWAGIQFFILEIQFFMQLQNIAKENLIEIH